MARAPDRTPFGNSAAHPRAIRARTFVCFLLLESKKCLGCQSTAPCPVFQESEWGKAQGGVSKADPAP